MIGYKVTATSSNRGYSETYTGWFEGDPKWENKAKEFVAKQVLKKLLKAAAGGPVVKAADVISKPLQGLGSAASKLIGQKLEAINLDLAERGLDIYDVDVSLTGDFEGTYRVADSTDLRELPKLLALIPEKYTEDEFMGESVLEAVFMAHVNFARYLHNIGQWKLGSVAQLAIEVEL